MTAIIDALPVGDWLPGNGARSLSGFGGISD